MKPATAAAPKNKSFKGVMTSMPKTCASPGNSTREKLEWYCNVTGKGKPTISCNKLEKSRRYQGKAYIPHTCGWVIGDEKRTKKETEDDAASKLVAKLNI